MDFSFYALLTVACLVLVLAMWACSSSSTEKWGPDLTLELPPHLLQEALFGVKSAEKPNMMHFNSTPLPSAPSEKAYDPLLCNEHAVDISDPPVKTFQQRCKLDLTSAVQVLPSYVPAHKVPRPVFSTFKMEQPV